MKNQTTYGIHSFKYKCLLIVERNVHRIAKKIVVMIDIYWNVTIQLKLLIRTPGKAQSLIKNSPSPTKIKLTISRVQYRGRFDSNRQQMRVTMLKISPIKIEQERYIGECGPNHTDTISTARDAIRKIGDLLSISSVRLFDSLVFITKDV
jgi:hypothetical protein